VIAALLIIATAMLFGGGSRIDIASNVIVRTVAIAVLAWSLIKGVHPSERGMRFPIMLAGLWTAMIGAQLIPLPPELWAALPQRRAFFDLFRLVGVGDAWRPLTMSPNATMNAFFASLLPMSVLIAVSRVRRSQMPLVVGCVLAITALSALLGIIQITSQASWSYFYSITNEGAAVGLFANRNHQALLMAESFPLLALVAAWPNLQPRQRRFNEFIALGAAVLLVPLILITGSRAGLVLMLIGGLASVAIYRAGGPFVPRASRRSRASRSEQRRSRLIPLSLTAGLIALVGLTVVFSRAEAISRLFSEDVSQEIRLKLFRTMLGIGNAFAPWGGGFGTFDPLFRMREPFDNLSPTYINHAHNDLLEIYIEGGIVALVLVLAFVAWVTLRSVLAWRPTPESVTEEHLVARCGSVLVLMALVASLADYPLRTPAHEAVAAVAVAMLAAWPVGRKNFW
jgi:O-antigen ligase